MRKKHTTGATEPEGLQRETLWSDMKSIIKDTNQSETPEASPTPLPVSSHNLSSPSPPASNLSLLAYYSHPTLSLLFPPPCSSLSPLPWCITPIWPYSFRFPFFSSLLLVSPSAAVSRPRHPTLPSAADINQPLRGKQREGRRERGMEEGREKASRQPVIRTNVDGLRIAGREEHNSFASLFIFLIYA